jgi:cell division protein FtsQ
LPEITGLPKFSGRDHLQVIELYRQLSDDFSAYQKLQIAAIALDGTKAVRVVFANGIMVTLNRENIEPQLDNLEAVLKTGLADRLDDVATIDLRYNNGAAVAWRKNTIAYNQSYAGANK